MMWNLTILVKIPKVLEWQARGHLLCEESKLYLSVNAIEGLPLKQPTKKWLH